MIAKALRVAWVTIITVVSQKWTYNLSITPLAYTIGSRDLQVLLQSIGLHFWLSNRAISPRRGDKIFVSDVLFLLLLTKDLESHRFADENNKCFCTVTS